MTYDAIVLLGFSGVGKDTTFAELDRRCPGVYSNVKFALLGKHIVAKVFDIPVSTLEDKGARQTLTLGDTSLTPLAILTVLYKGATQEYTDVVVQTALDNAGDRLPVFTDVRREGEMNALVKRYKRPLFFYLWRPDVSEGVNDAEVEMLANKYQAYVINNGNKTATDVTNTILEIANEY